MEGDLGGGGALAIGASANVLGSFATSLGTLARASGEISTAVGARAEAGSTGTAVGGDSKATGSASTALVFAAAAAGNFSTAVGMRASASGTESMAFGVLAYAIGSRSIAIGRGAGATVSNSVALGGGSRTTTAVSSATATINGTAYTYAGGTAEGVVSVGNAGAERQIQYIAAGQVSGTSTDAVNGSQLYATNRAVDALGVEVDAVDGRVTNVEGAGTVIDFRNAGTAEERREGVKVHPELVNAYALSAAAEKFARMHLKDKAPEQRDQFQESFRKTLERELDNGRALAVPSKIERRERQREHAR